ncbi:MAG: GAF domain-containing protein, partial [Phormidesmis sp.]
MAASNLTSHQLDVSRLLFDLKLCTELVSRFTGWLDADAIALCTTDGLIEKFDCAFARIWLIEADRSSLRLVASSGLYTRLDGDFARVPMGAFKVGKIAQNCIPFLSNCLADEEWVKDREWAINNNIRGFAGLPLMVQGQAIGVLALFSQTPIAPEFLEVLQVLSLSVTGALASAMKHQALQTETRRSTNPPASLSECIAGLLGQQKLSLLGTEQPL